MKIITMSVVNILFFNSVCCGINLPEKGYLRIQLAGDKHNENETQRLGQALKIEKSKATLIALLRPVTYQDLSPGPSSPDLTIRREFLGSTAGMLVIPMIPGAELTGTLSPNNGSFSSDTIVRAREQNNAILDDILSGLGFAGDRKEAIKSGLLALANSTEINNLFHSIDSKILIDRARKGEAEPLKNFLGKLWSLLEKKRYVGSARSPHPLLKLIGMEEDISLALEEAGGGITEKERSEIIMDSTGCTAKSLLIYMLFKYKGIDEIIGIASPSHLTTGFSFGGGKYLIAEFTWDYLFCKEIDSSIYSEDIDGKKYEGYYFLKKTFPEEMLALFYAEFNKGGLTLLKTKYKITDEQILSLAFPYLHINDLAFARRYNRAVIFSKLKRFDDALKELSEAEIRNPKYDGIFELEGFIYREKGDHEKAFERFDKAIDRNSQNAKTYINRGSIYGKMERWSEALRQYYIAIKLGTVFTKGNYGGILYANIGISLFNLGKSEEAEIAFDKSIKLNPGDATSYFLRAHCKYISGLLAKDSARIDGAIEDFVIAVKLDNALFSEVPAELKEAVASRIGSRSDHKRSDAIIGRRTWFRSSLAPYLTAL